MPDPEQPRITYRWFVGDHRTVKLVLLLLFLIDALFFAVHLYATMRGSTNLLFYIDKDMSYAEVFQYFKFAWLLVLVALYAFEHRSWQVGMWLPVFAYFLADDALQFHERGGQQLVGVLGLTGGFGLRAVDFGELIVTGVATLVLMIPLIVGYLHSDARSRWIYRVFLVLVGVLAFFGVALDMLHIILGEYGLGSLMAFLEDGGEMLSVTAMVAFALRINLSGGQPGFALPAREHASDTVVVARRASGVEH